MAGKYFWIKERRNPQFKDSYFVACGQITAKEARDMERKPIYGSNHMLKFTSQSKYEDFLSKLISSGASVQVRG